MEEKILTLTLYIRASQLREYLDSDTPRPLIEADIMNLRPAAPLGHPADRQAKRPEAKTKGSEEKRPPAQTFKPLTVRDVRDVRRIIKDRVENDRRAKPDKKVGETHAVLLGCQRVIEILFKNSNRYSDKEFNALQDAVIEEASKAFPDLPTFARAGQPVKDLVCDWMERFFEWLDGGRKGGKQPFYILPPKWTEDAMREYLERAGDDLDGLENNGRTIVGHLKTDVRFTDAERQELMICLKDLFVGRVTLACGGHVSGAQADRMANAIFGTRPRQRSPHGQRSRSGSDSNGTSDNDAPPDGSHKEPPETPAALPRQDKKPPPASEKDKAARRRADKERAEAKRAQREARREQMEARRRDPNYGEMKSPTTKEKNKGKKSKDRRADNDTAQAA